MIASSTKNSISDIASELNIIKYIKKYRYLYNEIYVAKYFMYVKFIFPIDELCTIVNVRN